MYTEEVILQVGKDGEEEDIIDETVNNTNINCAENNSIEFKYDLFVSHSSEDKQDVIQLCQKLEERQKLKCMIADRDFHFGVPVLDNCKLRMEESRKVLLIITPSFLKSRWCTLESYHALMTTSLGQSGKVIPVLFKPVEEDLPDYLAFYTYIDKENVYDLPQKIFEAFHNPGIVDGIKRKINTGYRFTQREKRNQIGAKLFDVTSVPVSPGCCGKAYYYPPLKRDCKAPKEVRELYEEMRGKLNKSVFLRWNTLLACTGLLTLLTLSILVVGVLFLVILTRIFIFKDNNDDFDKEEITAIVIISTIFFALTVGTPLRLLFYGREQMKKLQDQVWNDSMESIKQRKCLVVLVNFNVFISFVTIPTKMFFVRYDICGCQQYTTELLKTVYPKESEDKLMARAERMIKETLYQTRPYLVFWEQMPEVMEDNRHNTFLDRECACELIAKRLRRDNLLRDKDSVVSTA